MSKTLRSICIGLGLAFLAGMALTGCREPGPAEEVGREIDDAVEEVRDAVEDLGAGIDDAVEEARDAVENLRDDTEDATEEAHDAVENLDDDIEELLDENDDPPGTVRY